MSAVRACLRAASGTCGQQVALPTARVANRHVPRRALGHGDGDARPSQPHGVLAGLLGIEGEVAPSPSARAPSLICSRSSVSTMDTRVHGAPSPGRPRTLGRRAAWGAARVLGPSSLVPVLGPWSLVHGPWSLVHGPWSLVHGPVLGRPSLRERASARDACRALWQRALSRDACRALWHGALSRDACRALWHGALSRDALQSFAGTEEGQLARGQRRPGGRSPLKWCEARPLCPPARAPETDARRRKPS